MENTNIYEHICSSFLPNVFVYTTRKLAVFLISNVPTNQRNYDNKYVCISSTTAKKRYREREWKMAKRGGVISANFSTKEFGNLCLCRETFIQYSRRFGVKHSPGARALIIFLLNMFPKKLCISSFAKVQSLEDVCNVAAAVLRGDTVPEKS